ncbi:ABC transporter permease [Paenibacillus sp. FSL R10-2734]|uniref:ABC transporter permease n=1 Tax=Paenibacillus sp. FSL R10-2734 TaxID=2954691 RepID=UPI0030DAB964
MNVEVMKVKQQKLRFKKSSQLSILTPLIGLILLIVMYVIALEGNITSYNLEILLNQSVIMAVVSIGAIYIFSIGAFDISLGASTAVSAMCGVLVYNQTESILMMLITCILVGVTVGLINSLLAAVFNLPAFVSTIAMLSILTSITKVLLGGKSNISMDFAAATAYDTQLIKLIILGTFFGICYFIFHYTAVGRRNKFLGGNPISAKQTGISVVKQTIISFTIAGLGVGLAAFLTITRAPTLSASTASSIGMDVLIAVVFGGMPVSGGARSRVIAALIGSVSIVLLNQILLIIGASFGMTQLIKGLLFLLVVFIAGLGYRTKLLTR